MKEITRYQVIGKRAYREHPPGTIFEACIGVGPESRAVARGSIRVIERLVADLPPDRYRLPLGWPTYRPQQGGLDRG